MNLKMKIIMILTSLLMLAGCAVPAEGLKQSIDEKILEHSREVSDRSIPRLVARSLNHFDDYFPITVIEDSNIRDTAQAARVYKQFEKTEKCIISINLNSGKGLDQARMNGEKLDIFVFLHEIAHCADGEPVPNGVSKDDWLESLADGYAAAIMLRNKSLSSSQVANFSLYRKSTGNNGASMMDNYLSKEENSPKKWNTATEKEILDEVKKIRRQLFTA